MSHILVVDDSAADRTLAGHLLESQTSHAVEYASDGSEALEQMQDRLPLAVVTDLLMPMMDGMQLVKAVQLQYPTVPVILMTAFGSEEIALQALIAGAADFVPKSQLAADLSEAVESVLALTVQDRPHMRLAQCLRHEELRYELDNDTLLIPPLVEQLGGVATDLGIIDKANTMRFAKSLTEALRNAIYHGNLELPFDHIKGTNKPAETARNLMTRRQQEAPFQDRKVHVHAIFSPGEARMTIRDEGSGFDYASLPDVKADPSQLVGREGHGHGLVLIKMFMDDVIFDPPGNKITLIKRAPG